MFKRDHQNKVLPMY